MHPIVDFFKAQKKQVSWTKIIRGEHQVNLCTIIVVVVGNFMYVEIEEEDSKNGTLWNSIHQGDSFGFIVTDFDYPCLPHMI